MSISDLPSSISSPPSDSEVLVRVENVSKKFCRSLKKSLWYGVKDIAHELSPFGQGDRVDAQDAYSEALRQDEFWAVNDVSFELRRGECLGLIGHNGAGKTTLLKMLNGLIKPDTGKIEMRGRVGALIALGAGFNPILTGRENIYVNGSILGLTKREVTEKLDEIIDFAEIGEFIDAPVQSYSSGMTVRLGFAVAATLSPDILILDEVLAVGDFTFRNKCMSRISALLQKSAVIFVSHQSPHVRRICDSAILLDRGRPKARGSVEEILGVYETDTPTQNDGQSFIDHRILRTATTLSHESINYAENLQISVHIEAKLCLPRAIVRVMFLSHTRGPIAEWNSWNHQQDMTITKGHNSFTAVINQLPLRTGAYQIEIEVLEAESARPLIKQRIQQKLAVSAPSLHATSLNAIQI